MGKRLEIWRGGSVPVGVGAFGEKNLEAKYQNIAIRIIPRIDFPIPCCCGCCCCSPPPAAATAVVTGGVIVICLNLNPNSERDLERDREKEIPIS